MRDVWGGEWTGKGVMLATSLALAACAMGPAAKDPLPGAVGPADPAIAAALSAITADDVRTSIAALTGFGNRNSLSTTAKSLPPGQGAEAAADWVAQQFEAISANCGGCLEVHRDRFVQAVGDRIPLATPMQNVYAVLRGSDPAQAARKVMVTAHYDSRDDDVLDVHGAAPGANDDASGVAVVVASAKALSQLHPQASIVFAAVDGEEQGLYGSAHLAALAHGESWQLDAVLNDDIVGGDLGPEALPQAPNLLRVFSEGVPYTALVPDGANASRALRQIRGLGLENDSPSRQLARATADIGRRYLGGNLQVVLELRPDRYLRGGDHLSFNEQGYAAVRLTEWRENFAHQHQAPHTDANGRVYGDLIQFVNMDYVMRVARLNAAVLAELASAPPPPAEVRLEARELENRSVLHWQAGAGAPAGTEYELLWRQTQAADWEFGERVGADTQVAVPLAKDNVQFAVRAVDAAGHHSLAVLPMPQR